MQRVDVRINVRSFSKFDLRIFGGFSFIIFLFRDLTCLIPRGIPLSLEATAAAKNSEFRELSSYFFKL
jgi:hypothetical protein